jgi:hypothetical protein
MGLLLLRSMIDRAWRGWKKTVPEKTGRASGRREKKWREMLLAGRKWRGVNRQVHLTRLTAVSGHR